jgi:hypothetical protein
MLIVLVFLAGVAVGVVALALWQSSTTPKPEAECWLCWGTREFCGEPCKECRPEV